MSFLHVRWPMLLLFYVTFFLSINPSSANWYPGDLHGHSNYSDGDAPLAEVIRFAEQRGLKFLAITDHDVNMAGVPRHWADPAFKSDKLVLLYGLEWTTPLGHANVWSAAPFSYDELWQFNQEQEGNRAIEAAHRASALFSINHALPAFTKKWQYPILEMEDSIEIWNSMYLFPSTNFWTIHELWEPLLNDGARIVGVGGSDAHYIEGDLAKIWSFGNPTTWVYAKELSRKGIIDGIKAGHISVSYAPDAARIEFSANADSKPDFEVMAGDRIRLGATNINFQINVTEGPDRSFEPRKRAREVPLKTVKALKAKELSLDEFLKETESSNRDSRGILKGPRAIGVFKNGELVKAWRVDGAVLPIQFSDKIIMGERGYYRVELIGRPVTSNFAQLLLYGRMISMSNPIYY